MPGSMPSLDLSGVQIPWYFRCPISLELMRDPVTISTGQTYDRSSIESWVATGNTTCPVTRTALSDFTLIPNHTLRRLIQEWCVAHRDLGVERIPTPKQPIDPDQIRSLLSVAPTVPSLRRLRTLARESDKNRAAMATPDTRAALFSIAFSGSSDLETFSEAFAVLALVGLGEAEASNLVNSAESLDRVIAALTRGVTLEWRVNAAAIVESAAAVGNSAVRSAIGAVEGVMEALVKLIEEEKGSARAVMIGTRAVFALCLCKENRSRAVDAGAASAIVRRVSDGFGELERGLAALELMCRVEKGREAVAAEGEPAVAALVRAMANVKAAEHAAGALVAVLADSVELQLAAVRAGAMAQLLVMVQGGCSDRAKRKAQVLLKILRPVWPQYHDDLANSDDFMHF